MRLKNGAPTQNTIGITSNPLAEYRRGLNSADWALSRSTLNNANPESAFKLNPSLWSQARGLLPNVLIIPQLNLNMDDGTYYTTPNGASVQRANLQVNFMQSQL